MANPGKDNRVAEWDRLQAKGGVWVTGASSGIGRALCTRLVAEGRWVAGSARSQDALCSLRDELGEHFYPIPVDITSMIDLNGAITKLERSVGPINLAVLNAAIYEPEGDDGFDGEAARETIKVNVLGTVNCLAAVLPRMRHRGVGHIALMASAAGYRGLPHAAAYGASRAAVLSLAESLKFELQPAGITVQVITPGFVDTQLTAKNTFPMPFIITPDYAAQRIASGLRTDSFEITFPRRFTYMMKLLRLLPYRLYFPLVRRITGA